MRLVPLFFLLAACTKASSPEDSSDTSTDSTHVSLKAGEYVIASSIVENGCGSWGPSFNDSIDGFALEISFPATDTARFHWVNPQDCDKVGNEVTCSTDQPLVLDDYAPDNDAQILYEDRTELIWNAPDSASGTWTVDLSCRGEQCELIAEINNDTYPCTILMDWSLTLQSDQ